MTETYDPETLDRANAELVLTESGAMCRPCVDAEPQEFTESPAGYRARERWARSYDDLNGAPEGDWDR